jgi:hypothetical protein
VTTDKGRLDRRASARFEANLRMIENLINPGGECRDRRRRALLIGERHGRIEMEGRLLGEPDQ